MQFAPGTHVLLDVHSARHLDDADRLEAVLRAAAESIGATVITAHFHSFGTGSGVTGVVLLRESHISVHTWPETGYAALDLFVCGDMDVEPAIALLIDTLRPAAHDVRRVARGQSNQVAQPS